MRGLRTKTNDFYQSVLSADYDIIALTETGLNDCFNDSEIFDVSSYCVYRCDRSLETSARARFGGVLISVSSHLSSDRILTPANNVEEVWSIVSFDNGRRLIIGVVYLPPSSPVFKYEQHVSSLDFVLNKYPDASVCVVGDFNLPAASITFSEDHFNYIDGRPSPAATLLIDAYNFHSCKQLNRVLNHNNVILDLFFTNIPSINVAYSDLILTSVDSHHPPLVAIFNLKVGALLQPSSAWVYNFRNADYSGINDYFESVQWEGLLDDRVNQSLSTFYSKLRFAINSFVPKTKKKSNKFPPWFSSETVLLLRLKNKAYAKYKSTLSPADLHAYRLLRKNSKRAISGNYLTYIHNIQFNIQEGDTKPFWKFVNNRRKSSAGIPNAMFYENVPAVGGLQIANLFAEFFKSVFVHSDSGCNIPPHIFGSGSDSEGNTLITSLAFSSDEVFQKLNTLDTKKGCGPDGIPAMFLINCSHSLYLPLTHLFNASLKAGIFPDIFKQSWVTPIFKSGDKSDVQNYRPISGLCILGKVFESLVLDRLMPVFKDTILTEQHGFIKGRSTCSNLVLYSDHIANVLENFGQVDSIYTDFRKAFDRVVHTKLIIKLFNLGIRGKLLMWSASYLSRRQALVRIKNHMSALYQCPSGVPQGSHLGPFFFLCFINDIKNVFKFSNLLLFADDLKIYRTINCPLDCALVQYDIFQIEKWCISNQLDLNVGKCCIISFSRSKLPLAYSYSLFGRPLSRVSEVRDLGILLAADFSFDKHIEQIIAKGNRLTGFVKRTCSDFTNLHSLLSLFTSLIRSNFEYCSIIWNPYFKIYIDRLEMVQKKFVNFIFFRTNPAHYHLNYSSKLSVLNIKTLAERRTCCEIMFVFKVIRSIVLSPELLALLDFFVPQFYMRTCPTLHIKTHRTAYGSNSPISRLSRSLNKVSGHIDVFSCTKLAMKIFLKDFQFS